MLGLGAGLLVFGTTRKPGPGVLWSDGSSLAFTTSEIVRSTELRHAEAVVRFEPFFWRVRPFVEAYLGFAVVWSTAKLVGADDAVIESAERQHTIAMMYGATLGLNWNVVGARPGTSMMRVDLTAGIKRLMTTATDSIDYAQGEGSRVVVNPDRSPLGMWAPLLGITLVMDTRPVWAQ